MSVGIEQEGCGNSGNQMDCGCGVVMHTLSRYGPPLLEAPALIRFISSVPKRLPMHYPLSWYAKHNSPKLGAAAQTHVLLLHCGIRVRIS